LIAATDRKVSAELGRIVGVDSWNYT
jgi:hypothetical protein